MIHPAPRPVVRSGQLQASTVFALTLALLAGLIGAYLFKTYVLNGKTPAPPAVANGVYQITVAAVNLTDKALISPGQVKTLAVSREEFERVTSNPKYLRGSQAVNRTTIRPIRAEEPIFEDYLEPLEYPRPVSVLLRPGKRAVILEIPSKQAMVQVGDRVDLLCTLSNDSFGPGQAATAVMARDVRVVARFNTTQTAARPTGGDITRTYTLETTPYRHALIELARTLGATFALSVSPRVGEEGEVIRDMEMDDDPQTDRVTSADLAKIFGVTQLVNPYPARWEIERWVGVEQRDSVVYEGYTPPSSKPTVKPGSSNGSTPPAGTGTGAAFPPPMPNPARTGVRPGASTGPTSSIVPASASGGSGALAYASTNASNNFGFRAAPAGGKGCKSCGKKK